MIKINDQKVVDVIKPNDILKVRVNLAPEDYARWPEIQESVRAWGEKHGYVVNAVLPQMIQRGSARSAAHKTHSRREDSSLVEQYVKIKESDSATERTGLRILSKG